MNDSHNKPLVDPLMPTTFSRDMHKGGENKEKQKKRTSTDHHGLPSSMNDAKQITAGLIGHDNPRSIGGRNVIPLTSRLGSLKMMEKEFETCRPPISGALSPPYSKEDIHKPNSKSQLNSKNITSFQTNNVIVGKWAVTDCNVPTLPEHYPLERSSIFVPNTSATVVAARVADCLRLLSIAAQYSTGSKVKAKCLTSDSPPVEFRVFLYRGKKKFSHGIIVEVQRRFGYSPKFPMNTAAILDAAEGKVLSCVPNPLPPSWPSFFQRSVISSEDNDDLKCLEIPTLTVTKKMLLDSSSNQLALESLLSLTDPKKVGLTTASNVVKSILSKNEGNIVVTDILLNLVLDIKNVKGGEQIKRQFAFMIWTNIFSVITIVNNSSILQHYEECLAHQLVPAILHTINKKSSKHFVVADIAAKCLYFLLKARRDIKDCPSLIDSRALDILSNAYCYGREYHESLAKHSELCIITIKNDEVPALP